MGKHTPAGQTVASLAAAGALTFYGAFARADTVCGSTSAGWNVPGGAAVVEASAGMVSDLLGQLGEYYSHSMLSHGPDSWVTHSTSIVPPHTTECSYPVDTNFMRASTPGLSTIDQGAAYTFLYLNGTQPDSLIYHQAIMAQNTDVIVDVSFDLAGLFLGRDEWGDQWSWHTMGGGNNTVYGMDFAFNQGTVSAPQFVLQGQIYYGWSQYMNIGNTNQGYPTAQPHGSGWGVVCATSLSMWQHDADYGRSDYTGDLAPRTYDSGLVTNAANVLWNDVYNACSGQTTVQGWTDWSSWATSLWSGLGCLGISVCGNAADQIVNAFAGDDPGNNNGSVWQNIVHNSSAYSVSPDDIVCKNGNGTGAPCLGQNSSFWGYDGDNQVQWNSGGNSYGCWQQ
jgi:hypothetical protein